MASVEDGRPGMASGGWYPGMGGMSGGPMAGGPGGGSELLTAEGKPIVVEWSTANQAALQAISMNWTSPTTLQVLYAQEDLWVLRALMLIIKATNGDADAQYNAAVKEIVSIDLGAMAPGFKLTGQVGAGGAQGGMMSGGMMSGGMMSGGMMSGGMMSGGMMSRWHDVRRHDVRRHDVRRHASGTAPGVPPAGASGGTTASSDGSMAGGGIDPANGRYVDDKNESLTGERLRSAIKSDQPADAFLAVAKRMPMRMRVRMNVLKLPLFCASFPSRICRSKYAKSA